MPTEIIMPQMGESIFEGTITKWLKAVGDTVAIDEPLFEISTDKVDAEIPSSVAGVLAEIRFPEGATVEVSTVVGIIGEAGSKVALTNTARRTLGPCSLGGGGSPHPLLAARPPHRQGARPRTRPHRGLGL
jgi:2-oxoglutarate dehydrogenase E2 component (dihydrolipoamide succinyltransferase)